MVDTSSQLGIIQPAVPLEYGRRYFSRSISLRLNRYVVGVRDIHTRENPTAYCKPSPAMHAILTHNNTNATGISQERYDHYWSSIIPFLLNEKWETFDIQLTWDFVTASRRSMLGVPELMMRTSKAELALTIHQRTCQDNLNRSIQLIRLNRRLVMLRRPTGFMVEPFGVMFLFPITSATDEDHF